MPESNIVMNPFFSFHSSIKWNFTKVNALIVVLTIVLNPLSLKSLKLDFSSTVSDKQRGKSGEALRPESGPQCKSRVLGF